MPFFWWVRGVCRRLTCSLCTPTTALLGTNSELCLAEFGPVVQGHGYAVYNRELLAPALCKVPSNVDLLLESSAIVIDSQQLWWRSSMSPSEYVIVFSP